MVCRTHGPGPHARSGGLPGRGARLARGARPCHATPLAGDRGGFRRAPGVGGAPFRGPLVGGVVARGVRGPGRRHLQVAGLRGGVLRGRRPGARLPERHQPPRAHPVRPRHARAARADPAGHGERRHDLGAGLVRAGGRLRPRVPAVQSRAHAGWLAALGAEDLVVAGRVRRPRLRHLPYGSGRGEAPPGPHLPDVRPAGARCDGPAHRAPRRQAGLRRAVPRRRLRTRRGRHRRGGRGLADRHVHDRQRARPDAALPGRFLASAARLVELWRAQETRRTPRCATGSRTR